MSKKPVGCMAEADQEAMLALLPPAEAAIFRKALAANAANAEVDAAAAAAKEKLFALLSPEQAANTRRELAGTGTRGANSGSSDSKIRRTGMLSGVWIERVERLRSTGKAVFTSVDLARICSVAESQAIKVLTKETKTLVSVTGGYSFPGR